MQPLVQAWGLEMGRAMVIDSPDPQPHVPTRCGWWGRWRWSRGPRGFWEPEVRAWFLPGDSEPDMGAPRASGSQMWEHSRETTESTVVCNQFMTSMRKRN